MVSSYDSSWTIVHWCTQAAVCCCKTKFVITSSRIGVHITQQCAVANSSWLIVTLGIGLPHQSSLPAPLLSMYLFLLTNFKQKRWYIKFLCGSISSVLTSWFRRHQCTQRPLKFNILFTAKNEEFIFLNKPRWKSNEELIPSLASPLERHLFNN